MEMKMRQYTEGWCPASDGTNIFFSVAGPGHTTHEPDIVLCDGVGCDGFVWKYLAPTFATKHRVIRSHYRGHGRSAAPSDLTRLGMNDLVDDLSAVMTHVGVNRPAVLIGHSMGVQVILEMHRRMPDRVAALIPTCGSYGDPLATFHDGDYLKRTFPYLYRLLTGFPEAAMRLWRALLPSPVAYWTALLAGEVNRSLIRLEDLQPYFEHLSRMDAEVFVRMLHLVSDHSARDHLTDVDVPTLIIGAENDTFTPSWLSHEMADLIPNADLLMVPKGSHAAPIEQPDLLALRVEKFLAERIGCYSSPESRPRNTAEAGMPRGKSGPSPVKSASKTKRPPKEGRTGAAKQAGSRKTKRGAGEAKKKRGAVKKAGPRG